MRAGSGSRDQTLVSPAVAARRPHRKRRRSSKEESPSPGRHSPVPFGTEGSRQGILRVWAIKRCPRPASPCSGCRADVGNRPGTLRVAPGDLRERLTFRRWRVDRPLDGGLARRLTPRSGWQWHGAGTRRQTALRQASASEMAAFRQDRTSHKVKRCMMPRCWRPGPGRRRSRQRHTVTVAAPCEQHSGRRGRFFAPPAW